MRSKLNKLVAFVVHQRAIWLIWEKDQMALYNGGWEPLNYHVGQFPQICGTVIDSGTLTERLKTFTFFQNQLNWQSADKNQYANSSNGI